MPTPFNSILEVDSQWFRVFQERANEQQKRDIREIVDVLQSEMTRRGYAVKRDDREQILIGAVCRYLTESQQ